jgi:hypothetical protein
LRLTLKPVEFQCPIADRQLRFGDGRISVVQGLAQLAVLAMQRVAYLGHRVAL